MARERDYAYEALAEVTGSHQQANRGELNVSLKAIREQSGIEDSYLLSAEIHERAKLYRHVMGDAMLTPTALAKHWTRLPEEVAARAKPQGSNLGARESAWTPLPRKEKPPEWVQVWFWLRFRRNPRNLIPLPQSEPHNPLRMSMEEYEGLRDEWHAAGGEEVDVAAELAGKRHYAAETVALLKQVNT